MHPIDAAPPLLCIPFITIEIPSRFKTQGFMFFKVDPGSPLQASNLVAGRCPYKLQQH